ncbi:MAG: hypothetical protein LBJ78_03800 [Puniceicoccales bacterium]|jgi:hypothetical protein|nr:hypothetical protein [Puniceicoccales bacterium]
MNKIISTIIKAGFVTAGLMSAVALNAWWCDHCKKVHPEYNSVCPIMRQPSPYYAVDATEYERIKRESPRELTERDRPWWCPFCKEAHSGILHSLLCPVMGKQPLYYVANKAEYERILTLRMSRRSTPSVPPVTHQKLDYDYINPDYSHTTAWRKPKPFTGTWGSTEPMGLLKTLPHARGIEVDYPGFAVTPSRRAPDHPWLRKSILKWTVFAL